MFVDKVFSLSGSSAAYPAYSRLPHGGPPFHPRCTKRIIPFNERLASPGELEKAKPDEETSKLLGKTPEEAQAEHEKQKSTPPARPPSGKTSEPATTSDMPEPKTIASPAPPAAVPRTTEPPPTVSILDLVTPPKVSPIATQIRHGIEAVGAVHRLPAQAIPIPLVRVVPNAKFEGQIKFRGDWMTPIELQVRRSADAPQATTVHELGHYFESQAAGRIGAAINHPAFAEWETAVRRSEAFGRIYLAHQRSPHPHLAYLLRPWEMFARTYTQWVALRSGDAELLSVIMRTAASTPVQWQLADIGAIGSAFDLAIERLGLKP